jgi:hypothetical protein
MVGTPMQTQALPHGTQECMSNCPVCRQATLFRAIPGRSWFCTVCGTPNDIRPVAIVYKRSHWFRNTFLTLCVLAALAWGAAELFAGAQVQGLCGGPLAGCTLTLSNNSFLPLRLGKIVVDGRKAQGFGSAVAGPFGKTSVELYDLQGHAINTAHTISYVIDGVPGPTSWHQTLSLSYSN